jgi:hypothetical protein
MPQQFHYPPILGLASSPRLDSYKSTFSPTGDAELYGLYVWAQHVVGALYPITQHAEISLRNAIDREARRRFADKWWNLPQFNVAQTQDFVQNLRKAERALTNSWRQKERIRLSLPPGAAVPTLPPAWNHDQIVAGTDFSTWEYVLRDDFSAPTRAEESDYLWPRSMGKVFRHYNSISTSSVAARHGIYDLVREVRQYRNRLFHHDKIWVNSTTVANDARTAIDSIRRKIRKMEALIGAVDPRLVDLLEKVGVFGSARRVCSVNDLDIYRYAHSEPVFTARKKRTLRSVTARVKSQNITTAWVYGDALYGLYRIR